MCFHISNRKESYKIIEKRFDASFRYKEVYEPYYHFNGFEKKFLYLIPQEAPNTIIPSYWGLMPEEMNLSKRTSFLKKTNTLNATYERLHSSQLFKKHIMKNRCLIIADGLYEPHKAINSKQAIPYYFQYKDQSLFTFAGIYSELDDDLFTASIITVEANNQFKKIHNKPNKNGSYRMPLIVDESQEHKWLSSKLNNDNIDELLFSFTSKELKAHPVSRDVFNRYKKSDRANITDLVNYSELNNLFGNDI